MRRSMQFVTAAVLGLAVQASTVQANTCNATPANMKLVELTELAASADSLSYQIEAEVMLGSNPCMAQGNDAFLATTQLGDQLVVSAQMTMAADSDRICTREFRPVYKTLSKVVSVDSSSIATIVLSQVTDLEGNFFESIPVSDLVTVDAGKEVRYNRYCDPEGTMYLGGTPLFNEMTGESLSLEEYLTTRGLDRNCKSLAQ